MNNVDHNHHELSPQQAEKLLNTLQQRFEKNRQRHPAVEWAQVLARLQSRPLKLAALDQMENTGGEPDVISYDQTTGEILFVDCSAESPTGRRSLCYDRAALESRKEHRPQNSALDLAATLGIELLSEEEYRALQALGEFDTKTSSWLKTPAEIRKLGGALFGDRRYQRVFVYHNGADSYYAARGFRACLWV